MNSILSVKNVTKTYGPVTAVDHISFDLEEGSITGLLGPNGAGKTTTIQMLLGLLDPTAGDIEIFGLSFKKHRRQILSQLNFSASYVHMPHNLSVYENLLVFAHLYGVMDHKQRIEELLRLFRITHLRDRRAGYLSSGEEARLNLAKAFMNDPKLMLLDEPTASLDPDFADQIRTVLLELYKERGLTILYTSHNMREVEAMCDRIIFLQTGKIIADSSPEKLMDDMGHESMEDVFISIARNNRNPKE